jgi:hypothetical protein
MVPGMRFLNLLSAVALTGCSVVGIRTGTPEPAYRVVATLGQVEIRDYAPRIAASTVVSADEVTARSIGFRRLAGFIFGKNSTSASIEMTAPVVQAASSKIAMTAPVVQQQNSSGAWVIQFIMPAEYTLRTLPKPLDPEIQIITLPAETFAVYRFSGSRDAAAEARGQQILARDLAGSDWAVIGPPLAWFYDPPWTLPWFRRNEVALQVKHVE